jgi:hypothetical protein
MRSTSCEERRNGCYVVARWWLGHRPRPAGSRRLPSIRLPDHLPVADAVARGTVGTSWTTHGLITPLIPSFVATPESEPLISAEKIEAISGVPVDTFSTNGSATQLLASVGPSGLIALLLAVLALGIGIGWLSGAGPAGLLGAVILTYPLLELWRTFIANQGFIIYLAVSVLAIAGAEAATRRLRERGGQQTSDDASGGDSDLVTGKGVS